MIEKRLQKRIHLESTLGAHHAWEAAFLTGGPSFEKARATGDLHSAEENLRRFFEQRFNDGSDS